MHFTVQPFSILFPFSCICSELVRLMGFPHSSVGKESTCNSGDSGSIPGWGRCPGEGNGNPLQYSCLEDPTDRGAWWAAVHEVVRVRNDFGAKPPPPVRFNYKVLLWLSQ